MNYDDLNVPHDYDVNELSEALVEHFNFSEADNPTGTKSDMLHYEGGDGQENGYAIVTDDTVTFVPYERDIDEAWERDAERAIEDLMDLGETRIPLDELYDGTPAPDYTEWEFDGEPVETTLDQDFEYF